MSQQSNIFPFYDKIIPREFKEKLLTQRAKVIWLTGLSGSGKTTLALNLEEQLHAKGFLVSILDGDNIRSGINNNLSFTEKDRIENIRRIAEVAKLFLINGVITINGFVSPTEELRNMAKEIIGADDFIEVFVNTPIEVCEERDVKGLYKKARAGIIKNFTGIDAPFEIPQSADLILSTVNKSVEQSVGELLDFVLPQIEYKIS